MSAVLKKLNFRMIKTRNNQRGFVYALKAIHNSFWMFLKHSTPKKLINYFAIKYQKYFKFDRVWGMPYRYTIDPLNICNLRCPLCATGLGILGRDPGKMSLGEFQQLVNQIAPYAYTIELYNWGEPFLHPQVFEMISYASKRNISVWISSNMNRFNQDMAKKTVDSGLDYLVVSVDGATQETYEKYRRRGDLNAVLENIRLLVEEKKKARSRLPFIVLRMIINRHNETEIKEMRSLAEELDVDTFSIHPIFIDTTDPNLAQEWLPKNEELSYYEYSSENIENVWHCSDLWERMTINWDGGIAPCCWLHKKEHDIGNVFNRDPAEIWNSEAYISSRRVFSSRSDKNYPQKTICTVCKGRPLYLKF